MSRSKFTGATKKVLSKKEAKVLQKQEILELMENSLVNIKSLHNIDLINQIGKGYKLNSILLENELHAEQKQKLKI
jgi:hypothetical protein